MNDTEGFGKEENCTATFRDGKCVEIDIKVEEYLRAVQQQKKDTTAKDNNTYWRGHMKDKPDEKVRVALKQDHTPLIVIYHGKPAICSVQIRCFSNVEESQRRPKAVELMTTIAKAYCEGNLGQHALLPYRDSLLKQNNFVLPKTAGVGAAAKPGGRSTSSATFQHLLKRPAAKTHQNEKEQPSTEAPATKEHVAAPSPKKTRPPTPQPQQPSTASTSTAAPVVDYGTDDEMEHPGMPLSQLFASFPHSG